MNVTSFIFVKGLDNRPGFVSDSSIKNLIKHMKETQITDYYNKIIKMINMNIEDSSYVQYQEFQIDDSISKEKLSLVTFSSYPFYSTCDVNNII